MNHDIDLPRFCAWDQLGHGDTYPYDQVTSSAIEVNVWRKDLSKPPYTFAFFQSCLIFGDNVKGHAPNHRMAAALLEGNPYAATF